MRNNTGRQRHTCTMSYLNPRLPSLYSSLTTYNNLAYSAVFLTCLLLTVDIDLYTLLIAPTLFSTASQALEQRPAMDISDVTASYNIISSGSHTSANSHPPSPYVSNPSANGSSPASSTSDHGTDGFDNLVTALRQKLGPSSGITDDDVNPQKLQSLMADYISKESEWERYAFKCPVKAYTRNLVDKGNGKSNLVSRWKSGLRFAPLIRAAHPRLDPGKGKPNS